MHRPPQAVVAGSEEVDQDPDDAGEEDGLMDYDEQTAALKYAEELHAEAELLEKEADMMREINER